MENLAKIVIDANGGDFAPEVPVKAGIMALNEKKGFSIVFIGFQDEIEKELLKYNDVDRSRIEVVNTTEKITTSEVPTLAIMNKKDSSIVKGMKMVRKKEAIGFISSGNSGAILVGGQTIIGRIKGVIRPALAPLIPTKDGVTLLIDCGANVDARPEMLEQFAVMGTIYMRDCIGVQNPSVKIVNIGAEEEKGNALVKETFPLLKSNKNINFQGSVEARDIPYGACDVCVCEAFVGNVILKLYEGIGKVFLGKIKESFTSSIKTKIGALLTLKSLKSRLKVFDVSEHGGAPMLGIKGLVVKTHGSAKPVEIKNAIFQCLDFYNQEIEEKISEGINNINK